MIAGARKQAHAYHTPQHSSPRFDALSGQAGLQLPINPLCLPREALQHAEA